MGGAGDTDGRCLTAIAAIIGLAVLGGCLGPAIGPIDGSPSAKVPTGTVPGAPTIAEPTRTASPTFPEWNPPAEPFTEITVGAEGVTDAEPHSYTVWNAHDAARTISIELLRNGTTLREDSLEFPARRALELTLREPASYRLTIGLVGSNRSRTFTDPIGAFDCNARGHDVAVLEDGGIASREYRTLMLCDTPTPTATARTADA